MVRSITNNFTEGLSPALWIPLGSWSWHVPGRNRRVSGVGEMVESRVSEICSIGLVSLPGHESRVSSLDGLGVLETVASRLGVLSIFKQHFQKSSF